MLTLTTDQTSETQRTASRFAWGTLRETLRAKIALDGRTLVEAIVDRLAAPYYLWSVDGQGPVVYTEWIIPRDDVVPTLRLFVDCARRTLAYQSKGRQTGRQVYLGRLRPIPES